MSNNHFNYFRVKNFKRFKDLEVRDIGQFNLVLGDNNVGKTSLLEGFVFNRTLEEYQYPRAFWRLLLQRGLSIHHSALWRYFINSENYYLRSKDPIEISHSKSTDGSGNRSGVEIYSDRLKLYDCERSQEKKYTESYSFLTAIANPPGEINSNVQIPFIPFNGNSDEEVANFYMGHLQGNESVKRILLDSMTRLFPDIRNFEPSVIPDDYADKGERKTLLISLNSSNYAVPLGFFGEGTIRVAYVLANIILHSGSLLMIDEIDAGIHYSRMKEYWKVILQSAKENDVQIFATTHNRECIQYFIEALEELGEDYKEKARAIRLVEHAQTREVISFTNKLDEMAAEFAVGNEVR